MKIANRISGLFLAISLVITGIATFFLYETSKAILRRSIERGLSTAVASRAMHIVTYLNMLESSVAQLSKNAVIENYMKISGEEGPERDRAFVLAMERIKMAKDANPSIAEYLLMDNTGIVAASSRPESLWQNVSTDALFLGAKKKFYIKDVYRSKTDKELLIAVSMPLLDSKTDQLLGVVSAKVRLAELYNIVTQKTGVGERGEIYIINKYGYMITPSIYKKDVALRQMVDTDIVKRARLYKGEGPIGPTSETAMILINYCGFEVLGSYQCIPLLRWIIIAEIDIKEAFKPLANLHKIFLLILIIVPVFSGILGRYLARVIARPIEILTKEAEVIGRGDFDHLMTVKVDTKDEVGRLSRAFQKMVMDLKDTTVSRDLLMKEMVNRVNAQKEASAARRDWEDSFNAIGDMITIHDADFNIIRANKAAESVLGLTISEILKQKCFKSYHGKDSPPDACPSCKVFKTGKNAVAEIFEPHLNRFIEIKAMPRLDADGKVIGLVHIVRDITDRKKAEEKLHNALKDEIRAREIMTSMLDDNNQIRQELEKKLSELKQVQSMLVQSEKLASLGRLVSDMAHEVNNPLMVISGNAQLSLLDGSLKGELKNYIEIIHSECNRAKSIIERLLMFSRPGKGEQKLVDINASIESIIKLLDHSFGLSNVKIITHFTPGLPFVLVDDKHLQEVFMNLLNNARDAMPKGGKVVISTSLDEKRVKIEVRDSGVGMDEATLSRLFEPFFTTKEKGTGLGLSVCYGIIKAHNGELKFTSQPGKGSTAYVFLPITGRG